VVLLSRSLVSLAVQPLFLSVVLTSVVPRHCSCRIQWSMKYGVPGFVDLVESRSRPRVFVKLDLIACILLEVTDGALS